MVPPIRFKDPSPINLERILELQVRALIMSGVPEQVGMTREHFSEKAKFQIDQFVYSESLAANGLDQAILVHYAVGDDYLAEVCGVETSFDLNNTRLCGEMVLPPAFAVVQCNLGPKYKNRKIVDVRQNYINEMLGIVKEGLFAYLYWGNPMLKKCFMDFPGSLSADGHSPYLLLRGEKPYLCADGTDLHDPWGSPEKTGDEVKPRAYPNYGSVTGVRWF
jgi:hypothetical protein